MNRGKAAPGSRRVSLARMLLMLVLLLISMLLPLETSAAPSSRPQGQAIQPALAALSQIISRPQSHVLAALPPPTRAGAQTATQIDMKVLVIAADASETDPKYCPDGWCTDYPAIIATLDRLGIPYDVLIATELPLRASSLAARLSDGASHGYYQGIILTSGGLEYFNPYANEFESAFDDVEWSVLWQYEAKFDVRQVTWYTVPGETWPDPYGLNYVSERDTERTPITATLTAAGRQAYPYLNATSPIIIKNAYAYLGTVANRAVTTPLLTATDGAANYAIASITTYPDGRQNLAVTVDNAPELLHSLLLSYGNINWVTKGYFLGERHVYLNPEIDDLLIPDDIWDTRTLTNTTGFTYRMDGSDLRALIAWQNGLKKFSTTARGIQTEWGFVGEGATGTYLFDTLTPAIKANQAEFRWVNHTYSHLNLDPPATAAETFSEMQQNDQVATTLLGLVPATAMNPTNYWRDTFINPDISGLTNPGAQVGLVQYGTRTLISDTSMPGGSSPSPNTGIYTSTNRLLVIPRHPTNLFYDVRTPNQWVSEYNCYYGLTGTCPGASGDRWPTDLTYAQILDKESDELLRYLLSWDIDPLMFHQPNAGQYNINRSLYTDLMDAVLAKYNTMYNLPIVNLGQHDIGIRMANRMAYNASGVKATVAQCNKMTISTVKPAVVPITGKITGPPAGTTAETYGDQTISYISLGATGTVTITLNEPICQRSWPR